ncbi:hypothetical protein Pryu01_01420 [Paraliobacillus ryukyuensis]|uniref:Uncharacterized protein n=1 Tax=Paraliobacillus ryukyuensis TaxID=200904 RepID=A0A366ED72_9BACI|nr:hypothetical protein [Paraliobacillus ryukyuensis]RBO99348.1 hypothetical protein DES48_10416 [Paraliobacillus ryukyuensis]
MNRVVTVISLFTIASLFVLIGCGPSQEEALSAVKENASTVFHEEPLQSNEQFDNFSIYIPDGYNVVDESKSNLILESGNQTYILFYNALESTTSQLNYQAAESNGNNELLEAFETEERFGYVRVTGLDKDYELQVGIGGVKITTQTTLSNMAEDVKEMMQMANSMAYSDQTE